MIVSGGDQGLFNLYWADWATKDIKFHLPFIYNMTPNAAYGYAPAFQRYVVQYCIYIYSGASLIRTPLGQVKVS